MRQRPHTRGELIIEGACVCKVGGVEEHGTQPGVAWASVQGSGGPQDLSGNGVCVVM